jgi:hypothetical protein
VNEGCQLSLDWRRCGQVKPVSPETSIPKDTPTQYAGRLALACTPEGCDGGRIVPMSFGRPRGPNGVLDLPLTRLAWGKAKMPCPSDCERTDEPLPEPPGSSPHRTRDGCPQGCSPAPHLRRTAGAVQVKRNSRPLGAPRTCPRCPMTDTSITDDQDGEVLRLAPFDQREAIKCRRSRAFFAGCAMAGSALEPLLLAVAGC